MERFSLGMPEWLKDFLSSRKDDFSLPEARMALAIDLSAENIRLGTGGPFGAAVFTIETHELVSCGVNRVEGEGVAAAHAEIMALSLAQKTLGCYDLGPSRVELVSSSQFCSMCFGAVIWSGIRSALIGARGEDVESLAGFDEGPLPPDWIGELERRGITVCRDVLRDRACAVLRAYRDSGSLVYNSSANRLRRSPG